jgi:glutaminyl-tRNA synthetase
LKYTVMSKCKHIQIVNDPDIGCRCWDDPRLPTISGLPSSLLAKGWGIPASAVRQFADNIGVTKYNSLTDIAVFEHAIRDDLNRRALRRLAVLRPLKLVITNLPENHHENLDAINPDIRRGWRPCSSAIARRRRKDETAGTRKPSLRSRV